MPVFFEEQTSQSRCLKDPHSRIFAHPRLPLRRDIEAEGRNLLGDHLCNLLFRRGAWLNEVVKDLCTRIY